MIQRMNESEPQLPPAASGRLFQINEDDLAELERILPDLQVLMRDRIDNKTRTQLRKVQRILTDVRWNYGPHAESESGEW